ncbi:MULTISPECIES: spore coat protein [unclassified Paenibacillus]|uniref:spore coat protein n=1 Tax=unclassified Paenibacillus TaxID=185978 RepID=UPI001AE1AD91|nr:MULTISPECIES: spore coat protein [unclassified Paenibacillus]MBP1157740.1 spore coat protein CotF [Paenibacillus sp. PvP091]MBP1171524.1 spore coat protein CotF [Paenibacillus sp. PvR098]MBP2442552.1 spore coat protein CotF [Paenibacillus sp. PvP052]
MYQQNVMNSQQTGTQAQPYHLNEQDTANLVLSELKRAAREYTTAALEATHPAIRQTFANLTQKTLQDQAELFDALSQINGYGSISMAAQHEVQQELQQQIRRAEQLQLLVQRSIQSEYASANAQQQQMQQQSYPSNQPFQQTGSYQTGYGSQGQPASAASFYGTGGGFSSYPNQGYGSSGASGISQGIQSSHGFSSSTVDTQDSDYNLKSSLSGTDSQSDFSAKSTQDYTSNKFSSGGLQEPYSSKTQQDQSYSSSGVSSSSARPSGTSHNSKYMM